MFDWIVAVVRTLGYPGIALLTFLENVVPPIPWELIMPLAGFIAARDGVTIAGAIAAGTAGSLVRGYFRRHSRWVGLTAADIDRAMGPRWRASRPRHRTA